MSLNVTASHRLGRVLLPVRHVDFSLDDGEPFLFRKHARLHGRPRCVAGMPSRMPSVVLKYVPLLEREFRARKQPVGPSWRLDETYVRVKGSWKYVYRAVDKAGATVDFL
jgi:hypothetical protein